MIKKHTTLALLTTVLSATVFADTTIITPTVGSFTTAIDGNITITNTGRVTFAGDAITMDASETTVTINPTNQTGACGAFGGCAIVATAGIGVNVTQPLNSVMVGAASTISATSEAVAISSGPATLNTAGNLYGASGGGAFSAVSVTGTGGTNTVITNNLGGIIQSFGTAPTLSVTSAGAALSNVGTIQTNVANQQAILFDADFVDITNDGTIYSKTGAGLQLGTLVGSGPFTGNITNSVTGLINAEQGLYPNAAYWQLGAFSGTFTNAGTINNEGNGILAVSVLIDNGFGTFNNTTTGKILSKNTSIPLVIVPNTVPGGTFNNAGLIQGAGQAAVSIAEQFDLFTNSGTIEITDSVAGFATIVANNLNLINGFINTGKILYPAPFAGKSAIDFGSGANNTVTIFQKDGLIQGDVITASNGGIVLTMTGGTIDGDVSVSPTATGPSTLNFDGGIVTGTLSVGFTQADIVNITGTQLGDIDGNVGPAPGNTYNVSGGSFTGLQGGTSKLDQMFVTGDFVFPGPNPIQDLLNISINKVGIHAYFEGDILDLQNQFLVNAGTAIIDGLLTDGGAGLVLVQPMGVFEVGTTGDVTIQNATNNGVVALDQQPQLVAGVANNFNMTVVNTYTQTSESELVTQIGGPLNYGTMKAATALLPADSFITATLEPIAFIPEGSIYPIVNTTNAMATIPFVINPSSVILSFEAQLSHANKELDLIAHRNLYEIVALTPNTKAVAATLDGLAVDGGPTDPDLLNLLIQLDVMQSSQELTDALAQLTPPMDFGMVEGARIGMNRTFYAIQRRLENVHGVHEVWNAGYEVVRDDEWNGMNYGDILYVDDCFYDDCGVRFGTWAMGYGELLEKKKQNEFNGYKGNAVGFALGMDWTALQNTLFGVCGSYTKVNIESQNSTSNVQDIASYQGTFYAFFEPMDALYTDFLLGMAFSKFQNRRNILFSNIGNSAFSDFNGIQMGSQFDIGYVFLRSNFFTAPVGRMKYTQLRLQNYTETGAGGLNLSVINPVVKEWLVGGGLRFAYQQKYAAAIYVPEAEVMYLYAIDNQGQQVISNFLGGGTAFYTNSNAPGKDIVLVDLGINAHTNDGYVFTGKFEWEWRNHFMAYSGFLQLYHQWG